jgi:hypothetical protein
MSYYIFIERAYETTKYIKVQNLTCNYGDRDHAFEATKVIVLVYTTLNNLK